MGAQRTELMEGIFGLRAHTSGKVWIKREEVNIKQPRDAIQKSVALLTEDRRATGIMGCLLYTSSEYLLQMQQHLCNVEVDQQRGGIHNGGDQG